MQKNLNFSPFKENDQSMRNFANDNGNESNISFLQNDLSEIGKKMKQRMEKQSNDQELSKICLRRDSIVHSENSFYEKNTVSNQTNSQYQQEKQEKQGSNNQMISPLELQKKKNNQSYQSPIMNNFQEGLPHEKNNPISTVAKKNFPIDQDFMEDVKQIHQIEKGGQEESIDQNISDQIVSQSHLFKQQQNKKILNQVSSLTQKTGQIDSCNRNPQSFNFQLPELSANQKVHNILLEASQYDNTNDHIQSKKRVASQKGINAQKGKKSAKSEGFMKMKSEMFKLLTFIKPKIKKFLLYRTVQGRTKFLTTEVRQHINDYADCYFGLEKKNFILTFFSYLIFYIDQMCSKLKLDKIPLFDPENKFKIIVNTIIVIYNWFYIILVSLQLFFQAKGKYDSIFTYIAETAWITEMILQMNTACYHKNHFTTDRKVIMKIYLKEYFFFEVIPLIFQSRSSSNTYINIALRLPLLLKLKGMMIIVKKLEFYILLSIQKHYLLQLFKLVVETMLLGHIIACIWNAVAEGQIQLLGVQDTWKQRFQTDTSKWYTSYIECFYYAFATMLTVDTNPFTLIEKSFTALFMLVSSMQLAFIISTIDQILTDINKSQKEYKGDLNVLNQYMRRKKIDLQYNLVISILINSYFLFCINQRSLQRRVNIHLKKQYQQQSRDKILVEKKALSKLSMYMQNELIVQSNKKILKDFPFFYNLFTETTLSKIYSIMEEVVYAPFQIIYGQKSIEDEQKSIYFILKGSSKINFFRLFIYGRQKAFMNSDFQKGNKKKLITLKQGQSFGIYGFFTGVERIVNAYSNKFSTIIKIDRKKMLEILKENPRDYEKFMEVKDKIYFDQNYKDLNLNCIICESQDHLFEKCDRTHFNKQNPIIYYKFNYSQGQKRGVVSRKQIKKKNIKLILNDHVNAIEKLREEYNFYDEEDEEDQDSDDYIDEEDEEDEDDLENEALSIQQDAYSNHLLQQLDEQEQQQQQANKASNDVASNILQLYPPSNIEHLIENQQEKNQFNSEMENIIEKEVKNERSAQDSISSSQDLQSISRSEDQKSPELENIEVKSKKSLHYLNKKDDLNERLKSQDNAIHPKTRSSLRNEFSQIDQEEQIAQKKIVKIKTNQPQQKRRQSQQITLQSLEKHSDVQLEEQIPQYQSAIGIGQQQKLYPIMNSDIEMPSRRHSIQQGIQQKIRYDKAPTKTIKRMSVRYQNRVSIYRNGTLGNAMNQQLLFKKVGSQFQAVSQNPGDDIPLYWRMESLKDYAVYYPEYNSHDVIKRLQMYQMIQHRKKLKLQKKLAHSQQTANFSRLKSNQFLSQKFHQNQQQPSSVQQKTNQTRPSQFEASEI